MAEFAVHTNKRIVSAGRRRIATGNFTFDSGVDAELSTGLSRVERFRAWCTSTGDGPHATYYLNSNTASNNVLGYGGVVHVVGATSPTRMRLLIVTKRRGSDMAVTVRRLDMNLLGPMVEDVFELVFTSAGDTSVGVTSRLSWVEHVHVSEPTNKDMSIRVSPNSSDESTVDDNPGRFSSPRLQTRPRRTAAPRLDGDEMAYTVTRRSIVPIGSGLMFTARIVGDTSGTVDTGLKVVSYVELQDIASAVPDMVVNSSAISGGVVTLAGTAATAYSIKAIGY